MYLDKFAQLYLVLCKLHFAMYIVYQCYVCVLRLINKDTALFYSTSDNMLDNVVSFFVCD